MSLSFPTASETAALSDQALKAGLFRALDALGPRRNVLVIPPDFTRRHSRAGELTRFAWEYYGDRLRSVLPALGTHRPMAAREMEMMFGDIPGDRYAVHDWRSGLATLGEVPAAFVRAQSEGELDFAWPVEVNRQLVEGGFDLILSIGQVVPHEVAGMAGHNKNVLIGTGGAGKVHKSHYLGAVYGMERIMGRADNPVRRVLNYASDRFLRNLPIVYVLTVIGEHAGGLFIGDDIECFEKAAELSSCVNVTLLERPIRKAVVYLNPEEFHSTWLGNKAIYRTRMAIADGGELVVLAPGVDRFGEDAAIDGLVRRYGYAGTPAIRRAVSDNADLAESLGAAAHLIHGSSEGRFTITYCPGHVGQEEIEAVGYRYAPLSRMLELYDPAKMNAGHNVVAGEEVFFIANPALGLWAHRDRFLLSQEDSSVCGLAHRN
jgi:nickel-dependent lactate racemase